MSLPTLEEYANSLGFEPGMDVGPARIRTKAEIDRHTALRKVIMDMDRSDPLVVAFWHRFASIYLPSLLRTYHLTPLDAANAMDETPTDTRTGNFWASFMFIFPRTELKPHLQRFVAARPEETISFFHIQVQRVLGIDSQLDRRSSQMLFHSVMMVTTYLANLLKNTIPANQLGPLLRESGGLHMLTLVPQFLQLEPRLLPAQTPSFNLAAWMLEHCAFPTNVPYPMDHEEYEAVVGHTCALYPGRRTDDGPDACVKPVQGMQMSECARCKCVRYCSKAHQKKHWKAHKLVCFPPGW